LHDADWYLRQDIIWFKPNAMPESVKDRCTKAHEYVFMLTKQARYYFDNEAIKEKANPDNSIRDRDATRLNNTPGRAKMGGLKKNDYEMRNKRSVWTVPTSQYCGAHFAVFPPALIEPMVLASTRKGDIVLDPFMGSGTTAQVAQDLGRNWIGCELNPDYAQLQQQRTAQQGLYL
jgi:DNA modification methylase